MGDLRALEDTQDYPASQRAEADDQEESEKDKNPRDIGEQIQHVVEGHEGNAPEEGRLPDNEERPTEPQQVVAPIAVAEIDPCRIQKSRQNEDLDHRFVRVSQGSFQGHKAYLLSYVEGRHARQQIGKKDEKLGQHFRTMTLYFFVIDHHGFS